MHLSPVIQKQKEGPTMEQILNRVALEHDLPVSTVRAAMEEAIHEGYQNPNGRMKEVFGEREPTLEELVAYLAQMIANVEFDS